MERLDTIAVLESKLSLLILRLDKVVRKRDSTSRFYVHVQIISLIVLIAYQLMLDFPFFQFSAQLILQKPMKSGTVVTLIRFLQ